MNISQFLFRRVCASIILACTILGALMYASAHQPTADEKPVAVGSPVWHMDRCEPAPVGEFPTSVVMFPKGKGFVVTTSDPRLVHEALEQELNGVPFGHEVLDFCK
jgi:hypothetical protein